MSSSSILNNIKLLTSTFPIIIIMFMGPNQTKYISMCPIWNTSGTETVISVPVSVLGPERAGTEMGCIHHIILNIKRLYCASVFSERKKEKIKEA